jgi:hypothetical protein
MPNQGAYAGLMEVSGTFSYSQSRLGSSNYSWTRRWGVSVGYYFLALTEIEFSVQDILYRTKVSDTEDTTFHDQVYSVDWVQSFTSKNSGFQPYIKFGIGQLNRQISGSIAEENAGPILYDSITGLAGVGLRIFILKSFAIKAEGTTYLLGGRLSTAQENFSVNGGVSLYF